MLREIKWAYQRVRYGYDDRIKWGFDSIIYTIKKPLKEFCSDYLEDEKLCKLNPDRSEIYRETLRLIENLEKEDYLEMFNGTNVEALAEYFGKNIGWYWD